MNPEAVAIKLDPVTVGPAELVGKTPVVIFAEQGGAGANLQDEALPDASGVRAARGPVQSYSIDNLIIVLDRSTSMSGAVTPGAQESKLEHAKTRLQQLGAELFPEAKLWLVDFGSDACLRRIDQRQGWNGLRAEIGKVTVNGGTDYGNALLEANTPIVDSQPDGRQERTLMLFLTDGHDGGSPERAMELARTIGENNAAVAVIGAGADYDQVRLVNMSSAFAYSTWAHTPMPGQANVFTQALAPLVDGLRSAEHYLEIHAQGSVAGFYALTPQVREALDGACFFGYANQGVGICFVESDDVKLTLKIKRDRADDEGSEMDIPILDQAEAAAHFEKLQFARQQTGPLFVLLARLRHDAELLGQLHDAFPSLAENIRTMIENLGGEDAQSRLALDASASVTGSMTQTGSVAWTNANAVSRVLRDRPRGKRGGGADDAGLHSGPLGPLELGGASVGPLQGVNPRAYDKAPVRASAKLIITTPNGIAKTADLFSLPSGGEMILGRGGWMSSCTLLLEDPSLARAHLAIRRGVDGFWVRSISPKHLSYLNGQVLQREHRLAKGDEIRIGNTRIKASF